MDEDGSSTDSIHKSQTDVDSETQGRRTQDAGEAQRRGSAPEESPEQRTSLTRNINRRGNRVVEGFRRQRDRFQAFVGNQSRPNTQTLSEAHQQHQDVIRELQQELQSARLAQEQNPQPAIQPPQQQPAVQPPKQQPAVQPPKQQPAIQPPKQQPVIQHPGRQVVVHPNQQPSVTGQERRIRWADHRYPVTPRRHQERPVTQEPIQNPQAGRVNQRHQRQLEMQRQQQQLATQQQQQQRATQQPQQPGNMPVIQEEDDVQEKDEVQKGGSRPRGG